MKAHFIRRCAVSQLWGCVNSFVTFWISCSLTLRSTLLPTTTILQVEYYQILSKKCHAVCVWQPLETDNLLNSGKNGIKWISCAAWALFFCKKKYHSDQGISGRTSTSDADRSGRPVGVATPETNNRVPTSIRGLALFNLNSNRFLRHFITV